MQLSNLKILVVDNSPTMRRILINTLQKAGYPNCYEADDGKDALARLLAGDFEMVMTDWDMPNMDGLELTEMVRKDNKLKDLLILMVTTRNMKEDIVTAIKTGVNGYVIKPFDAKTINAKIEEIMGK